MVGLHVVFWSLYTLVLQVSFCIYSTYAWWYLWPNVLSFDSKDPYKCKSLVEDGRWMERPGSGTGESFFEAWQPHGCMLHNYQATHIKQCLASKRVVLIGDSTIREVYWAIVKKLDPNVNENTTQKHSNIRLAIGGIDLDFIWDPYLNSTEVDKVLERLDGHADVLSHDSAREVAILLVGTGLWQAKHQPDSLQSFKQNIAKIGSLAEHYSGYGAPNERYGAYGAIILPWSTSLNTSKALVAVAPVHEPLYDHLDHNRGGAITPIKIKLMNGHLQSLQQANILWTYNKLTGNSPHVYKQDGIHLIAPITEKKADILLNLKCNGFLASAKMLPNSATCCTNYYALNMVELTLLVGCIAVCGLYQMSKIRILGKTQPSSPLYRRRLHVLFCVVSPAALCYICDRTQSFGKEHKHFELPMFAVLLGITLVVGFSTIQSMGLGLSSSDLSPPLVEQVGTKALSRDQTDEWKGWMQALILIYHYTGSSKVLWIYQIVRLLVAAYLFMTGFGHTVFFIQKNDYSIGRVASVLIRLNLLSVLLAYQMRTDYLSYYFAPLSSLWFIVVYLTMRFRYNRNNSCTFVVSKHIVSALFMTALFLTPGALEQLFRAFTLVFNVHWDLKEFRFRVTLDLYIVYFGSISGLYYTRKYSSASSSLSRLRLFLDGAFSRCLFRLCSLSIIAAYVRVARTAPDKHTYNTFHTYFSFIPVMAFAYLRNSHPALRTHYSVAFAFLGRCSLETFTLQFHLWLAGDTKGILRSGLFGKSGFFRGVSTSGRYEDLVLFTPAFIWLSHLTAVGTEIITRWIVKGKESEDVSVKSWAEVNEVGNKKTSMKTSATDIVKRKAWEISQWISAPGTKGLKTRLYVVLLIMWVCNWAS